MGAAPGLPPAAADAAAGVAGVQAVAVVRDGTVDLVGSVDASGMPVDELDDGWRIPLDVAAVDPAAYAAVVPPADRAAIAALGPGEALLSETSAELRRLGPGGRLDLAGGTTLAVIAVVPDTTVGAAEVVVDVATGAALGVDTPRAMLVAHDGDRAAVEAAIAATVPGMPVRFRAPGETPYLRAADAVLPQSIVKARVRRVLVPPGRRATTSCIDPEWVAGEHRRRRRARARHRALPPVDRRRRSPRRWSPSRPPGSDQRSAGRRLRRLLRAPHDRAGGSLSRHSWGIAFDIGYGENPTGAASVQRDQLVEILRDAGFTWGGTWLVPDPAHFERVV